MLGIHVCLFLSSALALLRAASLKCGTSLRTPVRRLALFLRALLVLSTTLATKLQTCVTLLLLSLIHI